MKPAGGWVLNPILIHLKKSFRRLYWHSNHLGAWRESWRLKKDVPWQIRATEKDVRFWNSIPNLIKSSVIGRDKDLYWKSKNTNYKVKNMGSRLTTGHEKYPRGWIAVASAWVSAMLRLSEKITVILGALIEAQYSDQGRSSHLTALITYGGRFELWPQKCRMIPPPWIFMAFCREGVLI